MTINYSTMDTSPMVIFAQSSFRKFKIQYAAAMFVLWHLVTLSPVIFAQSVLFDFDNAPQFTSLPIDQTVSGITAHLSGTAQGYSIQDANVLGFTPPGFAGHIFIQTVFISLICSSASITLSQTSRSCIPARNWDVMMRLR